MDKTNTPEEYWIPIARTGSFSDSKGKMHNFTTQLFDELVSNYDPAVEESPLVYGHPKDNEPARGWVKALKRNGEKLFALLSQVSTETKKAVHNKDYKYVSMSLHPCGKRLRHVGLLGAVPPAITGLGPVEFMDNNCLTINFSAAELSPSPQAEGGNKMDEATKQLIANLEAEIAKLKEQLASLEKEKQDALAKEAAAAKQAETAVAEFSAYKGEVTAQKREDRLQRLVKDGKVKPAEQEHIKSMVSALARADNGETVNFSSSDGVKQVTPEEAYWLELEARETSGLMSDFSAHKPDEQKEQKHIDVSNKI